MTPIYTVFRWFPACREKKVKKLVFQALSEEGTKREEHKREGICFNDLTSRWFICSKTLYLCIIAGGGTIVIFKEG